MPKFHTSLSLAALFCLLSPLSLRAQTPATPLPQGAVGLGTYATSAQFKDLAVFAEDRILLQRSLAEGLSDFTISAGQWKIVDGALQQSSTEARGLNIFTGDNTWTNYAVSVKARKLTGKEGFSLSFRAKDDKNFACLNVGGWSNTKAQFGITLNGNFSEIGSSTPFKVEDGRWYDIRVEVLADQATGFVDNQPVARAKLALAASTPPKTNPAAPKTNPAAAPTAQPRPTAASRPSAPLPDAPPIDLPRLRVDDDDSSNILQWVTLGTGALGLLAAAILYTTRRRSLAKSTTPKSPEPSNKS
jgi:hypothetical protein